MTMRMAAQREAIVACTRRCERDGLIVGTAGNVSVAGEGAVAMTPSSITAADMRPQDVAIIDTEGALLEGTSLPSSEWQLHLAVHAAHAPGAVVHTHSPYATAVSTLVDELPAIHYYVELLGGSLRVAPYATFGTAALAANVTRALHRRTGALMANHGAIAIGATLDEAYARAQTIEWLCQVYCIARGAGDPRLLDAGQLDAVTERLEQLTAARRSNPTPGDRS